MTDTTATPGNDTVVDQTTTATTDTTAAASASATTDTKAAADTGTLIDTAPAQDDKAVAAPATWPTNWRELLAGDDKKALDQLKRYGAPTDLWGKTRSLEQKLSSGEYKRDLPKDATPEQKAEWRKERGLPEASDGYLEKLALPDGVVLGEMDKPIAAAFAEAAFDGDVTPEQYSKLVAKYYSMQDQMQQQRAEADHQFKQQAEDVLRAEFGPEFRPNLTAVNNLVAGMPEGLGANLLNGRLADGRKIGDHPEIIKWMSNISRELNPAATLLPATSGDPGKGLADRIADIEKMMGDHGSDYWRGPKSESLQSEYRSLIEARDRINSRNAA